jgi:S-adenosylmethionine synthetase
VAKHIVAAGLAHRCTVQLSYAIGQAEPTSLYVNTYDSGTISDAAITTLIHKVFDLTPNAISTLLELRKPIYLQTAAYGHFGKSQLSWEVIHPTFIEQLQTLAAHHLS